MFLRDSLGLSERETQADILPLLAAVSLERPGAREKENSGEIQA